jgi:hypothetical protein
MQNRNSFDSLLGFFLLLTCDTKRVVQGWRTFSASSANILTFRVTNYLACQNTENEVYWAKLKICL